MRARHTDVAPDASWGYRAAGEPADPYADTPRGGYPAGHHPAGEDFDAGHPGGHYFGPGQPGVRYPGGGAEPLRDQVPGGTAPPGPEWADDDRYGRDPYRHDLYSEDPYRSRSAAQAPHAGDPYDWFGRTPPQQPYQDQASGPSRAAAGDTPGGTADSGSRTPGRAGRDLPMAIAVGVTLGALVVASLYIWRPAFVALVAVAIGVAIWEMARAVEPMEARPPMTPLLVGGVAIVVLAWFAGIEAMVLGLVLTVVAVLIWRLGEGPDGYQRDVISATLIVAYVPFFAGFAVLLVPPEDGAFRVTIMIAAVVLSDVGGYAAGVLAGRHPMAPTVSPKKSWEGFAGSLSASAAGMAVMFVLMLNEPWWEGAAFGAALAFAATLGDLCESLMKRDLGIKDMGRLLPGHGGLMDRLDSLLLAAPAGYLLLTLFAPPAG